MEFLPKIPPQIGRFKPAECHQHGVGEEAQRQLITRTPAYQGKFLVTSSKYLNGGLGEPGVGRGSTEGDIPK